jgi:hypothetical protein
VLVDSCVCEIVGDELGYVLDPVKFRVEGRIVSDLRIEILLAVVVLVDPSRRALAVDRADLERADMASLLDLDLNVENPRYREGRLKS